MDGSWCSVRSGIMKEGGEGQLRLLELLYSSESESMVGGHDCGGLGFDALPSSSVVGLMEIVHWNVWGKRKLW